MNEQVSDIISNSLQNFYWILLILAAALLVFKLFPKSGNKR